MPIDQVTAYFFGQGVLGVIVIVMGIAIVLQHRENRADKKELSTINAVLQEKRVTDSNTYSEKFIKSTETLLNQNKEIMTLIQSNQKALETVANILQSMK